MQVNFSLIGMNMSVKHYLNQNDYAKATEKAVAEGYDAVKIDPMMFDNKEVILFMIVHYHFAAII